MVGFEIGHEQVAIQKDSGEEIVEVVGDASGQTTDGLQFLGLAKALGHLLVMGSILGEDEREVGLAVCAGYPPAGPAQRTAVVAIGRRIELKAVALPLEQFAKKAFAFRTILRVNEIAKTESGGQFGAAEHLFQSGIKCGDSALTLAPCKTERCAVEKRT